ncbi:hypothetical protein PACTADRAFT_710 [Pachysolen tannophilus NRRL Y-2460]|uniref:Iron transporter FTH1 n=1 Tax=Pachysolen tannophilus NRRL Y-2460 TaxID=669874 RepID=A0A1E4U2J2_PACTA|nr:hypothetical protein PACTADRAFT_710 [Pachysolen tannophilus NRRL Y-2460]
MVFGDYFSVQIFFIILRETLESSIIISVLLSFLKQNYTIHDPITGKVELTIPDRTYRNLRLQVWLGSLFGLSICLFLGGFFVLVFYFIGNDLWSLTERLWEGIFSVLSSLLISVMGLALLRINQLQIKWKYKLQKSLDSNVESDNDEVRAGGLVIEQHKLSLLKKITIYFKKFTRKYALGLLPFVTTLREGLEAVVFVGGIGASAPASSVPLAVIAGGSIGAIIGVSLYRGSMKLSLKYFLILSSCFLYLVSAGLMSRGVWFLELEQYVRRCNGQDMSEVGSGPGSYDIVNSIWHVNCCNGLTDGGWMLFNALLGWTNSATYGSVISYNAYWLFVIIVLKTKLYAEKHGYIPFLPIKFQLKKIKKRIAIYNSIIENDLANPTKFLQGGVANDSSNYQEIESLQDIAINDNNNNSNNNNKQDESLNPLMGTNSSRTENTVVVETF